MKKRPHVLVVEDEAHLAEGIRFNLEADGYRVTTVGDGPSALRLIEEEPAGVDVVVLDLMLPGMSGYSVCEELRAARNEVPVLILSARTLAEDRTRGFDVGADQYLTKPFDLDEFLSRIRNLLTRVARRADQPGPGPAPEADFAFGGAVVHFDTFEATVAGETSRLTSLEVKLLRHFIASAGRIVPRSELLEKVWELPPTIQTRAPDQFIRRLRLIFEPDPSNPRYFLTVRDAGYRFLPEGAPD